MIFQDKKDFVSNNEPLCSYIYCLYIYIIYIYFLSICFMDSESSVPIFKNVTNMSLLNSSKHVFVDGTFSYAPKYFLQMFTIHVYFMYVDFMYQLYLFLWTLRHKNRILMFG